MKITKNIDLGIVSFNYTAEDEEPNCVRCNNCCDNQGLCDKCGPEFWWANYIRTENEPLAAYYSLIKGDK